MKVAFNARLLTDPSLRGWNRYTINLLVELADLGVELFLYTDRPLHESHLSRLPAGSYQVRLAPQMPYLWWEQYWLPKQCDLDRVDILHCPLNFGLPWFSRCRRVLTLHDAIDQIYYDRDVAWHQKLRLSYLQTKFYHWVARQRADLIITVSEHSKRDLIEYLDIPPTKIAITYEAADRHFHQDLSELDRSQIRDKYQLPLPYIFYVGGWETRKNIPFLMSAFAEASLTNVELVLAGGREEQKSVLIQLADSLGIRDRVRLLGWVDDADLPCLYAGALGFVYPSEYEGFGLQLCEAMAVGCPVLAANTTCLPEVLGDGGEIFSVAKPTELVNLLRRLNRDKSYYHHLVKMAKKRDLDFNWSETARQTQIIYRDLLCI
jgi:glycosyltransferase involved in cell wall biosynthesis